MKPGSKKNQAVPSWAVALVVLVTAGITVFAMIQTGYKPTWSEPQSLAPAILPWSTEADNAIQNVVPVNAPPQPVVTAAPPQPVVPAAPLPVATFAPNTARVDGTNQPPAHGERGVCIGCHTITDARGQPIPPLRSLSPLPHPYRGVGVNCHALAPGQVPSPGARQGTPAVNPSPFVATAAVQPTPAQPATPPATEGEWMGIEVAPITPLTSKQFSIAECTSGLVVVEAEAQAATVGLKPGDVVVQVDAQPISSMTDFFRATKNGTLLRGNVQVIRKGRPMNVVIEQTPPQPAAPPAAQPPRAQQQPATTAGMGPPLRVQP